MTMRYHRPRRLALTATAVLATVGLGAGTASAATGGKQHHNAPLARDATLPQIQAAAKTDVSNRVNDLATAISTVQKATDLGGDQAGLLSSLQGEVSGLQQLEQKIAGDTDTTTARADYEGIFTQYRVYLLELPRTRLVMADDRITNAAGPRLTKVASRIQAKETPANQAQAAPLLADLTTQVSHGTGAVNGQVATLQAATPAAWDANHGVLAPERSATKTAVADLKKAASDAKQAAADVGLRQHPRRAS